MGHICGTCGCNLGFPRDMKVSYIKERRKVPLVYRAMEDRGMDKIANDIIAKATAGVRICAALIDQDRHIGGDSVGHACDRVATAPFNRNGMRWLLCPEHAVWAEAGSDRISLPNWRAEVEPTP